MTSPAKQTATQARVEVDILLARILELAAGQQLDVYEALEKMLGEDRLGVETERSVQVRSRRDAVQAMREAAAHLKLPPGEAPGVAEFKKAARETTLCMGFRSVYQAFDNRWDLATRFYEGMPIPLTAAQRRVKRTLRHQRQDPIVALRLWWAETSPEPSAPAVEYKEWAVERNERRSPGWRRVVENTQGLCRRLGVSWTEAVALASGEKTLEEAQRDTKEARLREAGPLVVRAMVNEMLEIPKGRRNVLLDADFPNPVARLDGQALWRAEDVHAFLAGKRDFTHAPAVEQHLYMDEDAVALALKIDTARLRERLQRNTTGAYTRVPPPSGKWRIAGRVHYYWYRPDIESWVEALRRRPGWAKDLRQRRSR